MRKISTMPYDGRMPTTSVGCPNLSGSAGNAEVSNIV